MTAKIFSLLNGLTASDASWCSHLGTKIAQSFLSHAHVLPGTAVEVPVIINEYVHMFSFVMQAPVGYC